MPISKNGKLYVTPDQTARAESFSALDYALAHGYNLISSGRERYTLREHDSMVFLADGRWWWNSHPEAHGRALALLIHYEGRTFPEAVSILCAEAGVAASHPAKTAAPPAEPPPFVLPQRAATSRHLFAYLCKGRGLDRDIVAASIRAGLLYQGQYQHGGQLIYNAVFIGRDPAGVPRNAILRGITSTSSFRHEIPGSDKSWPFLLPGRPGAERLGLFEAPIDAFSEATYERRRSGDYRQMDRMALGGNFPIAAVTNYLDRHPQVTELAVGFDNDASGQRLRAYLLRELGRVGNHPRIKVTALPPPRGKDWNQFLQEGGATLV